jgi:hypothetical protein
MTDDDAPRWERDFHTYTTDDDGVWLELEGRRINLGFDATLREALDAAIELELAAHD